MYYFCVEPLLTIIFYVLYAVQHSVEIRHSISYEILHVK